MAGASSREPVPAQQPSGRTRAVRSADDAWAQIQDICRDAKATGRTIATIDKGIANRILDVQHSAIVRASAEARTPDGHGAAVTRHMVERVWQALASDGHVGRIRNMLFFAYALVAEIPGVAVDSDRRGLHVADWDLAMTPYLGAGGGAMSRRRYWTLAAHPARYRVVDAVRDLDEDWWLAGTADLHAGDRVAIWKYKGRDERRGIVAFGEVLTDPEMRGLRDGERAYWTDPEAKAAARRVRVRYVIKPSESLWLEPAPADSVIRQVPRVTCSGRFGPSGDGRAVGATHGARWRLAGIRRGRRRPGTWAARYGDSADGRRVLRHAPSRACRPVIRQSQLQPRGPGGNGTIAWRRGPRVREHQCRARGPWPSMGSGLQAIPEPSGCVAC
jgi:hypothetical protein